MNINEIIKDAELWDEYVKAYEIARPYRARVQFRLALLTMQNTTIADRIIFNTRVGIIADAETGWVCNDLREDLWTA